MQIIKLLRTNFEGDEYLVETGGVYKRSKQLRSFVCGSFQDRINSRIKMLYQFQNRFILPDFMDFNSAEPLFLFPYQGEESIDLLPLEDGQKIEIAMQLIDSMELLHHVTGEGFGIWGFPHLLVSDRLRILPPLWVNFNKEALKFVLNRESVFVAPEILDGKRPDSASDTYVLGKILQNLLPDEFRDKFNRELSQMTDEDPKVRPSHFGRLFTDKIQITRTHQSLDGLVKRELVSSHIVERDKDLREFSTYFEDLQSEETGSYLIYGGSRVGKTTFLNLIQTDLINNGWKTLKAGDTKHFCQELLQITENPEFAGVNMEDFHYLWELQDHYNLDRVARIVGKLIGIMDQIAILVDDFEQIDDGYRKLLDYVQSMIIPSKVVIIAASTQKECKFSFTKKYSLQPFNKEQTTKFLEIILGKPFINNYEPQVNWIYNLTNGFPGLIYNFLTLLNSTEKLTIKDGKWVLEGNIHNIKGMEDYVEKLFQQIKPLDKEILSDFAGLSENFTKEEFKTLCKNINLNVKQAEASLIRLQRVGLLFKEGERYRFAFHDIWEKAYQNLEEEKKKKIHTCFCKVSPDYSRKAWHYRQIGKRRAAAAMYLRAGCANFTSNMSWAIVEQYFNNAYDLLEKDEITDEMLMLPSLLKVLKGETLDEEITERFKRSRRLKYLYLYNLVLKCEFDKVEEEYHRIYPDGNPLKTFSDYTNNLSYVYGLYESGKIGYASDEIKMVFNKGRKFDRYEYLNILYKNLLAKIEWRNNHWDESAVLCKENMETAERLEMKFLLPLVYSSLGTIMDINGPHYSKPILQKAITYSEKYGIPQLSLRPALNLANSYLYSGDITSMFIFIEKSREISRTYNDRNNLALSYLIEGLYHSYNKQYKEALEDLDKAIETVDFPEIKQKALRFKYMCLFQMNDPDKIDPEILNQSFAQEYGFSDVVKLGLAEEPDEIKKYFNNFKEAHHLWKEEIAVAFKDKLSKNFPEEFERYLEYLIQYYLKSHLKLPIALTTEAFAYLYREMGQYRKAKKFARNAVEMYKNMKMMSAAEKINHELLMGEKTLEDYVNIISNALRSEKREAILTDDLLSQFESNLIAKINEMDVLHEIINFSKTITASAEPEEILAEFVSWILSFSPIRKMIIAVLKDNNVVYKSWMSLASTKRSEEQLLIQKMMKKRQGFIRTPFEAKAEFFVDETYKVMMYAENSNLMMSNEEFDRFALFIDNLEPIISMAIRNAISYRSSILDPLTGLYTRWFYTRRLEEEFDKSKRFNSDLSVIMADLDHFKRINDEFGHNVGDEVLKTIAAIIKDSVRGYDVVGRYGGEEFVVILPDTSINEGKEVAERIRKNVEKCDQFNFYLTISLGVTCTGEKDYEKYLEVVADADRALYYSKNHGRNQVTLYDPKDE